MLSTVTELYPLDFYRLLSLAYFTTLIAIDLVSFLLIRRFRPGRRLLVVATLAVLCWGVCTQVFFKIVAGTLEFWLGIPTVAVANPGNPDPVTRYEQGRFSGGGLTTPTYAFPDNVALTINDCVFGRSPRLYLGPYPSIEEATSLLDEQGETPVLRSGQLLLRGGHANYYICPANPLRDGMWIEGSIHRCFCDEFGPNRYSLCVSDIENDYILRVAALDETSLLVDTVDGIQIRWWDGQYLGRIWAEWRTDPPRR